MKKKVLIISILIIIIIFSIVIIFLLFLLESPLQSYVQNLEYSVTDAYIANPDQGFYRPVYIKLALNGDSFSPVLYNDFQLYHFRVDISDYSSEISDQSLNTLENALSFYYQNEKNVIIRFSYDEDFEGNVNAEPGMNTIVSHIEQLSNILNNYSLTITAIEAGMIGPYGEMHSSTIATSENINKVIDSWLDNCPDLPVLVRTSKMIYDYLGIDFNNISNYNFEPNDKTKRLGLFNDAFLSTEDDMGTYKYDRASEINWISNNITQTPFGGEALQPTISSNQFPNCLEEMDALNLSYLNEEYHQNVITSWKQTEYNNTTAYEYIRAHMGYRLSLKNSVLSYNDDFNKLEVELTIENTGFSNHVRTKDITLIFVDEDENIYEYTIGEYNGEQEVQLTVSDLPSKQNYDLYISFSNLVDDTRTYSIQFTNTSLYNSSLEASLIGYIEF